MLNRRLLRVKVMQALYALKQSKTSNYHLAIAFLKEKYSPDLNSMEQQDPVELEGKRKNAIDAFDQVVKEEKPVAKAPEEVKKSVGDALDILSNENNKDTRHFKSLLDKDIERIYRNYLQVLTLLVDLGDYAHDYEEEKQQKFIKKNEFEFSAAPFGENTILGYLKNNKHLQQERKDQPSLEWDYNLIKKVFKSSLITDEQVLDYLNEPEQGLDAERKLVLHIVKNIILKDKRVQQHFEEEDINWTENKKILKGMVVKTLKSLDNPDEQTSLLEVTGNWEEDKEFFLDLYKSSVEKDEELENIISEKTKNWDIERIALIDKVLLKMALTEMMTFSSIPVKVTINEYIELSKIYSTPKSKQFINGLLDKLSLDLINKGMIKKSGRGLIDNK